MIKGNLVSLRSIEKKDLNQLLKWRNSERFKKFFREYRDLNSNQQKAWYQKIVVGDKNTVMFSIIENKTKKLIGACGLCYINWIYKNADFSIYIGKNNLYIDDKLAFESGKLLLKYGFNILNLHRIWTEIYDFDKKKIKFLSKLKFKLEGEHRETYWYKKSWHNSLFYSILSKEYKF